MNPSERDSHTVSPLAKRPVGHPTLYTPELAARLADHIAAGLTDEEAAALEGISADCLTNWRKSNREFYGTIKWAEAERLKGRLARIERGEPGLQGTAWFLERCYPKRFSKPELQLAQQINVGTNSPCEATLHYCLAFGVKSSGLGGPFTQLMSQAASTVMNSNAPSLGFVHPSCGILLGR
jgi:hypothetical protein